MTEEKIQLKLNIDAGTEADNEELEQLTRQLRKRLLELDVESVDFLSEEKVSKGAKGEPITTTLIVTLFAAGGVVTTLIKTIETWLTRDTSVTIEEKNGDKLQMTGISSKEQRRIIDAWISSHTKP
ncbi:hypothetical protein DP113_03855 [Brasilonema octagenarum UFV-E1]|uniref:Uncharacterized protein n=2 Tax=Brasilonema TaxID=383614 RepID=A0A856MDQ4_9CYAN|nr:MULTISPECIES: hypothetical protein [Brasilonema]NMF63298.1 hypothetical protein [Brasilonema octagenarum UFV-OR1]QDL07167.1 hypothetical protein DP114_03900 [Brasilonema sennae CENA114]QDL13531.1 hypothetical protein DP113_03855 [Brasilonema octagenarum UFV-E1]